MSYILSTKSSGGIFVPDLVFQQLQNADANQLKIALYMLQTGCTAPSEIALALHINETDEVLNGLDWWCRAGLITETDALPQQSCSPTVIDDSEFRNDILSFLLSEVQAAFAKTLSTAELRRLIDLYQAEHFEPEVILLCAHHIASADKRKTVAELDRQLHFWQEAGVCDAASAEKHLCLLKSREEHEQSVAAVFNLSPNSLTSADKRTITNWFETFGFDLSIVSEAASVSGANRTIRYVNGILKAWHNQGYTSLAQIRGSGTLNTDHSASVRVDKKQYHSGQSATTSSPKAATAKPQQRRPIRLKRES